MIESEFLNWLKGNRDTLRTPSYIYSEASLDDSLDGLKSLLPDGTRIFYSLKANPQPGLVRYFARSGVGAEIASDGERAMCSLAGISFQDVLVGGVAKSEQYLAEVCDAGPAAIVVESLTEWRKLRAAVGSRRTTRALVRVNPGVSLGGLDMAGASQFGLSTEQAIAVAKECDAHPQTEFLGLHFYFGSQRLAPEPVVEMVRIAGETVQQVIDAGVQVEVVDLGLGCGVPYLEKDATLDTNLLRERLNCLWESEVWSSTRLWSEAGRALVGRSGYFVARVIEKKTLHGRVFIFLDGGLNSHNPGIGLGRFFRSNPRFLCMRQDDGPATEDVEIVGNLCTSADCIGRSVTLPILEEGDLVIIPNSGAYCQTTGLWGFNSQPLFHEGMLSRDGSLRYLEPQHGVLLKRGTKLP